MKLPPSLRLRWKLLKIAVRPHLSFDELAEAIPQRGSHNFFDIRGTETPFDFAARFFPGSREALPDFTSQVSPAATFVPADQPAYYNSEPSVARFLAELVFLKNPAVVVEVGCFAGWASVHMALALQARAAGGRLFCVDYAQSCIAIARTNLARHGVEILATTIVGTSLDPVVLGQLPPEFDLVFIDSSHHYPDTLQEIEAYGARLSASGCIVLHDSISFAGVRRSVREVGDRYRIHTFTTEHGNGVSVLTPLAR